MNRTGSDSDGSVCLSCESESAEKKISHSAHDECGKH